MFKRNDADKNLYDIFQPTEDSENSPKINDPFLDEEIKEEIDDLDRVEKQIDQEKRQGSATAQKLQDEIDMLQKALDESREKLVRALAEMENIRRRTQVDVEKAHKFSLEQFVKALLPIIDSLEKALETATEADRIHLVGIELTLKMFLDVLNRFGVKAIAPLSEPFDPALHEAVSAQPNSNVEANTVIQVFQKGYQLNGRLIRPAMVIVSQ